MLCKWLCKGVRPALGGGGCTLGGTWAHLGVGGGGGAPSLKGTEPPCKCRSALTGHSPTLGLGVLTYEMDKITQSASRGCRKDMKVVRQPTRRAAWDTQWDVITLRILKREAYSRLSQ